MQGCSFSATANHDSLWVRVKCHSWLAHALVKNVLVQDRSLDVVIKEKGFPEPWDVADLIRLIFSLAFENHALYAVLPNCGRCMSLVNENSGCVAGHFNSDIVP